jgi:hypothetical protein
MKSALLACEITSSSGKRLPERLEHRFNIYPLVNIQKAMENGHRNSGFTQLENGGSFHSNMLVYQRVNGALEKGLFF